MRRLKADWLALGALGCALACTEMPATSPVSNSDSAGVRIVEYREPLFDEVCQPCSQDIDEHAG